MRDDLDSAAAALDPLTLGRRLKAARLEAGLTQPELAGPEASAAYLSRIERGQRRPGLRLLQAFCSRLGVPIETIVHGQAPPDPRQAEYDTDLAELSLASGAPQEALDRVLALLAERTDLPAPLKERCVMVQGAAYAALGSINEAISTFRPLLDAGTSARVRAVAAARQSRLLRESGDLQGAVSVGEAVLGDLLGRDDEPVDDIIRLQVTVAAALWEGGQVERALHMCREAVTRSEDVSSAQARGAAYWNTAIIEAESGNLDEALSLTRRALSLFETESDMRLYARLRTQLGELLLRTDPPQTTEALTHLTSAQQAFAFTSADAVEVLHNELALAKANHSLGDNALAAQQAQRCLERGAGGHPYVAASAAIVLGRIELSEEHIEAARGHFTTAVGHLSAAGADRRIAQLWFTVASALDHVGLTQEAKDAYRRAAASTGLASSFESTTETTRLV